MSIKSPIGYILVERGSEERRHPIAMSASFNNYAGDRTNVGRNAFGEICEASGHRKPKMWKTPVGAQKAADQHNADRDKYGMTGGIKFVNVEPIYRDDYDMRSAVTAEAFDKEMMIKIVNFIESEQRK